MLRKEDCWKLIVMTLSIFSVAAFYFPSLWIEPVSILWQTLFSVLCVLVMFFLQVMPKVGSTGARVYFGFWMIVMLLSSVPSIGTSLAPEIIEWPVFWLRVLIIVIFYGVSLFAIRQWRRT